MNTVLLQDRGLIDYMECWKLQEKFFDKLVAAKGGTATVAKNGTEGSRPDRSIDLDDTKEGYPDQVLILCEHPHVYTLGKSGQGNNLLIDETFLRRIGATYHKVDRGGDITYHGPGQLVGYPILDLDGLGIGLKDYVHRLEQTIIDTIAGFGIRGERSEGATGVWLPADEKGPLRKIAAIGVRSSRFVTMHGFSLNVSPALEYFTYINPCGFTDRGVTSMERELGKSVDAEEVKRIYAGTFEKAFGIALDK